MIVHPGGPTIADRTYQGAPNRAPFSSLRNMSRPQTRRSVSVKGITHHRIKNYVDSRGESVASFLEMEVTERFGEPTDEDRRKFGELIEEKGKRSKAQQAAQEKPCESQEPSSDFAPIDKPRTSVVVEPSSQRTPVENGRRSSAVSG